MKYRGTYEVGYNNQNDEYCILSFPPLEVDNRVLAEVQRIYPGMRVLLSKVKSGQLDRELAAIQRGEPLPISESIEEKLIAVVTNYIRDIIQLIAEDSRCLNKIEWRDMEKVIAEVLEELGFSVELTPGSKDGGKDIIVECTISGLKHTYIVEIKHWNCSKRVGRSIISDFLNVIIRERRNGGLFLSTSGYCENVFEMTTEIKRHQLRFGDKKKVVSLCKTYVKARLGIWSPPKLVTEVLFEQTL